MTILVILTISATIAGSAMAFSNIFQAIKIFRKKSASDVSKLTYIILTLGSFVWLLYGIEIKNVPIIISNSIGIIITIIIIIGCVIYSDDKNKSG